MASSPLLFLPLFLSLVSSSSLLLPITKDTSTLQYITTLSFGTPLNTIPTNLVLDLGGPLVWVVNSPTKKTPSFPLRTIPHRSIQCLTAKSHTQTWLSNLQNPIDQNHPCQILPQNTITGKISTQGELVEDIVALKDSNFELLFAFSPTPFLLNGLASSAKGMLGLGKSRSSFSSQFFNSVNSQRKITFCLSSSSGAVLFGNTNTPFESEKILRSLIVTPFTTNKNQEYFINVNSIKISGKKVSFNTPSLGGTKLSTIVPYTTVQSSIYAKFESAFLKAALSMNMTRVASVAPFGLCFGPSSQLGPIGPPVIDFVLQSEMVKWSIHGRNSMVKVNDEGVMCLGFLDGGVKQSDPIVIGGYQLEDVLVEFDFDSSMVGFSSSLLMKDTSCSNFRFGDSIPAAAQSV